MGCLAALFAVGFAVGDYLRFVREFSVAVFPVMAVLALLAVVPNWRALVVGSMTSLALVTEWHTFEEWMFDFAAVAPEDESCFDEEEVVVAVIGVIGVALWAQVLGEVTISFSCALVV